MSIPVFAITNDEFADATEAETSDVALIYVSMRGAIARSVFQPYGLFACREYWSRNNYLEVLQQRMFSLFTQYRCPSISNSFIIPVKAETDVPVGYLIGHIFDVETWQQNEEAQMNNLYSAFNGGNPHSDESPNPDNLITRNKLLYDQSLGSKAPKGPADVIKLRRRCRDYVARALAASDPHACAVNGAENPGEYTLRSPMREGTLRDVLDLLLPEDLVHLKAFLFSQGLANAGAGFNVSGLFTVENQRRAFPVEDAGGEDARGGARRSALYASLKARMIQDGVDPSVADDCLGTAFLCDKDFARRGMCLFDKHKLADWKTWVRCLEPYHGKDFEIAQSRRDEIVRELSIVDSTIHERVSALVARPVSVMPEIYKMEESSKPKRHWPMETEAREWVMRRAPEDTYEIFSQINTILGQKLAENGTANMAPATESFLHRFNETNIRAENHMHTKPINASLVDNLPGGSALDVFIQNFAELATSVGAYSSHYLLMLVWLSGMGCFIDFDEHESLVKDVMHIAHIFIYGGGGQGKSWTLTVNEQIFTRGGGTAKIITHETDKAWTETVEANKRSCCVNVFSKALMIEPEKPKLAVIGNSKITLLKSKLEEPSNRVGLQALYMDANAPSKAESRQSLDERFQTNGAYVFASNLNMAEVFGGDDALCERVFEILAALKYPSDRLEINDFNQVLASFDGKGAKRDAMDILATLTAWTGYWLTMFNMGFFHKGTPRKLFDLARELDNRDHHAVKSWFKGNHELAETIFSKQSARMHQRLMCLSFVSRFATACFNLYCQSTSEIFDKVHNVPKCSFRSKTHMDAFLRAFAQTMHADYYINAFCLVKDDTRVLPTTTQLFKNIVVQYTLEGVSGAAQHVEATTRTAQARSVDALNASERDSRVDELDAKRRKAEEVRNVLRDDAPLEEKLRVATKFITEALKENPNAADQIDDGLDEYVPLVLFPKGRYAIDAVQYTQAQLGGGDPQVAAVAKFKSVLKGVRLSEDLKVDGKEQVAETGLERCFQVFLNDTTGVSKCGRPVMQSRAFGYGKTNHVLLYVLREFLTTPSPGDAELLDGTRHALTPPGKHLFAMSFNDHCFVRESDGRERSSRVTLPRLAQSRMTPVHATSCHLRSDVRPSVESVFGLRPAPRCNCFRSVRKSDAANLRLLCRANFGQAITNRETDPPDFARDDLATKGYADTIADISKSLGAANLLDRLTENVKRMHGFTYPHDAASLAMDEEANARDVASQASKRAKTTTRVVYEPPKREQNGRLQNARFAAAFS